MKRFLLRLLISAGFFAGSCEYAQSQVYNNEWINYNNTYYKFKVGATGLYRISQTALASLGLGSVPAEQFQLWRNGQEISLYTSMQTGPMGSSDYIEFWGEMNDGKPDNVLYRNADFQLNDKWSLQTDTAAFFLTVNSSGNNLRFIPDINDVAGNILPPEPFFMHTAGKYYKKALNRGNAAVIVEYVYSSAYDQGEGWSSTDLYSTVTPYPPIYLSLPDTQVNLNVYTGPGAPNPYFKINASGNALNQRQVVVKLNGDTIVNQTMDFFDYIKTTVPVTLPEISSGTANIEITNNSATQYDRMVVANYELVYPRQFNFDNATNFYFELPSNTNGNYLEISNFNYGSTAPVLYDLTNDIRYVADITNPALIKFALLPSTTSRKLVLVSEDATNIKNVTSFQQRNFTNFNLSANQGNYLIITHPVLTNGNGGTNPIDDYKAYRSSAAGGGYNAKIYMIDELVDQFGLGIKKDPLSIRNFIRWARTHFSTAPIKDVLLIGKGVDYRQSRVNESNPNIEKLCLVPTFGEPGSDNLLAAEPGLDQIQKVSIGRISAINAGEVALYLTKVIQYEQAQAFSSPSIQDKAWMKNVIHVVGVSEENLGNLLDGYMANYKNIISDTAFGANVNDFSKNSADAVQQANNQRLQTLFQEGLSLVTYFGHSSSTTLEFNLDDPQSYNNTGKYPVFILLGCQAGNFFNFNVARFQTNETISEKYILAPQRGGIACIASTHLGIVHYLDIINSRTYTAIANTAYGKTLGEIMIESTTQTFNLTTQNDYYARLQTEQLALHGDPAIRMNAFTKPDYVIEDPLVKISPSFVSIADSFFKVNANFMNIGKAINKNIVVEVKRTYPDFTTQIIKRDTISGIRYINSLNYSMPIDRARDKGLNKITITIDADNDVDELYETNNSVTKDIYIFEDEARPVYPNNFAIINHQNIKLLASTANPFATLQQYKMEFDTTELFNSPFKVTRTISSTGGVLEFDPGVAFIDGTVYYWRVSVVPVSGAPNWNNTSFIYLSNSELGFNQSHLYQHLKSGMDRITLDSFSRRWNFKNKIDNVFLRNGVYPTTSGQRDFYTGTIDDVRGYIEPGCTYNELIINVINPVNFKPWKNDYTGPTGLYQSYLATCGPGREYNFEYLLGDTLWRRRAMNFIDSIPDGFIVTVRINSNTNTAGNTYPSVWQNDVNFFGPNNSLYHRLRDQGFADLDSFYRPRSWIFIFKKNKPSEFAPKWQFSNDIYDGIALGADFISSDTLGFITSPPFGPAKAWKKLYWTGNSSEAIPGDNPHLQVIGVDQSGNETILANDIDTSQQNFCLSCINCDMYPYLKLRMKNIDSINLTPYQLNYWRLTYTPVPEGAIAPNIYLKVKDTLDAGEPLDFKIAFKNVSESAFDSLKVKMIITDRNNVAHIDTTIRRRRPLLPIGDASHLDTLYLGSLINTTAFPGANTLYIEANPDNDQPEQFHYNNFAYRNFFVKGDTSNPLLDVTFDGVHILNRDIVSSKPDIIVKLKDEAKWLILDDTSLLTLQVRYPNGSLRRFYFNNDTLVFTAAGQAPNPDNTATINFKPYFTTDGEYELIVTGKDRSGNEAGNIEYRIAFEVINKPMISNMLNYPNPFTTSTAFVFTITGYEIPQNIKIEIMTITGKIVREITKDELGSLHIGRNITEFKWDGTDQYGQKLANGIYLYRVVTNLNGKVLDKYKSENDNTDKYFNKGYGKMYLMR